MMSVYETAPIQHAPGPRQAGDAVTRVLSPQDFDRAADEIRSWPGYAPTPLYELAGLAAGIGIGAIHYKHEGPRFGLGSFKALGAAYAALRLLRDKVSRATGIQASLGDISAGRYRDEVAGITLVSATDGNHGRSLAWGCQRFGAPCRIYIHAGVSEGRAAAMRAYGAEVVRIAGDYDASVEMARREAGAMGWSVISDTSWPGYTEPPRDVMAGYGVMLREVTQCLDRAPSHVLVQCGVGGLAAATAAALHQHWAPNGPRVVVVEPDRAACLLASARAGRLVTTPIETETVMAGLSCGVPSGLAWEILAQAASDFVAIPDLLVAPTLRRLANPVSGDPRVEAGESGVAGLAALIAAASQPALARTLGLNRASRVLVIGSEGVTDPAILAELLRNGDGQADASA